MTAESSWAGGRSESWKERVPNLDPAILKLRAPSDVLTTRTEIGVGQAEGASGMMSMQGRK